MLGYTHTQHDNRSQTHYHYNQASPFTSIGRCHQRSEIFAEKNHHAPHPPDVPLTRWTSRMHPYSGYTLRMQPRWMHPQMHRLDATQMMHPPPNAPPGCNPDGCTLQMHPLDATQMDAPHRCTRRAVRILLECILVRL